MVEGRGFRAFCHLLNPRYQVPCRKTITSNLLLLYEEEKKATIELIRGSDISITTDCWTSLGQVGYITVTGHFITDNWDYKSIVLATRPLSKHHTGENIASTITEIQNEFSVKVFGICTDNASNMRLAGKHLGLIHWFCFSHGLKLALQAALKIEPIRKLLLVPNVWWPISVDQILLHILSKRSRRLKVKM